MIFKNMMKSFLKSAALSAVHAGKSHKHIPRTIAVLLVLFVVCILESETCRADDYVMSVGGENIHFTPQTELGYVVQTKDSTADIRTLDTVFSQTADEDVQPIRGQKQRNVSVVFARHKASDNNRRMAAFRNNSRISYVASLFSSNNQVLAVIPEIVVRLKTELASDRLNAVCQRLGYTIVKKLEFTDREYLVAPAAKNADDVFQAAGQLSRFGFIEWAVPNVAFRPELLGQILPNDTYFPNQWHLNNTGQSGGTPDADINAPEAWEISTGSSDITVAVLDEGVDLAHPDLTNNIVPGYDFYDDDALAFPYGDGAHGTACAGLIAAQGNNSFGVTGVAWNCRIMPVRIQGPSGYITEADIATAIRWAAYEGADVLSNSWGANYSMPVVHSAIKDVTDREGIGRNGKGCVILAAAGNSGGSGPITYPAKYSETIAVGATDKNDVIWNYSSQGPELDIVAPSGDANLQGDIWTTDIAGFAGYNNRNSGILDYTDKMGGTSGACPIAAGLAALILSFNPDLTNTGVRRMLIMSALDLGTPGYDNVYGYGRIDAFSALDAVLNPPYIYVNDDALDDPGAGDPAISDPLENGSAEHPFDSIQEAIDTAGAGKTVMVLAGSYTGPGNRDIEFYGKPIIVRSADPANPAVAASTIIDCQGTEIDPHRGFYFHDNETALSEVSGLTITNGYSSYGGGIFFQNNSNPRITNCVITNNEAVSGGGIYCDDAGPEIINCVISNNSADDGGGIYCRYENSPTLNNCNIDSNSAYYDGGGIYCDLFSNLAIINCAISGNSADDDGGGICCNNSSPAIDNCLINGNSTGDDGGGIYCYYESSPAIGNCTISDNTSGDYGGGIYCYYNNTVSVINSILWSDTSAAGSEIALRSSSSISIDYSDIQGAETEVYVQSGCTLDWGADNIDTDPLFVNGPPGNFYLSQTTAGQSLNSPCADAGNDLAANLGLDTRPTRTDGVCDAGVVDLGYHYPWILQISSIQYINNEILFHWNSRPDKNYNILWSTNLINWTKIPIGETNHWTDTDTTGYDKKFYRVEEK